MKVVEVQDIIGKLYRIRNALGEYIDIYIHTSLKIKPEMKNLRECLIEEANIIKILEDELQQRIDNLEV